MKEKIFWTVDDAVNPQVIYDPVAAADTADYYIFGGFFAISPWNHFYGETSTMSVTEG